MTKKGIGQERKWFEGLGQRMRRTHVIDEGEGKGTWKRRHERGKLYRQIEGKKE